MTEVAIKVVQLEEKMSVANNRIKSLEDDHKGLRDTLVGLDKTLTALGVSVDRLGETEKTRAKWLTWVAMGMGGVLLANVANFLLRGGLG